MPSPFTPVTSPAQEAANRIIGRINTTATNYRTSYNDIWNNPAATPDLVVAALGTQAQAIIAAGDVIANMLIAKGINVPHGYAAGWTGTNNPDGSITLTQAS